MTGSHRIACTLAAALLALPSQAQEKSAAEELRTRIAAAGTYAFSAREKDENGRTVCEETWIFRADGTYTIKSGEQQVEGTWLVEVDEEDLRYLWLTPLASTAGPDCQGKVTDTGTYPREEYGMTLLFWNDGSGLTCTEPGRMVGPDGKATRWWGEDTCWGNIRPVSQARLSE